MADEKTEEQLQREMFDQALAPPAPEPPAPEPKPEPEPVAAPPPPVPPPVEPPEAAIPSWRLREEAEARRVAEDRARALEERLNQVAAHLQQSQKQPDFFENPDAATQAAVVRALSPFLTEYQRTTEENRRKQMYNDRILASTVHGADKVDEAERAFLEAKDAQSLDPVDYERVVQSPNRYDEVVKWHVRQSVYASVGDDPNAWFEKELENRLADPQFQAKMLEKVRSDAAKRPSSTRLPPSLSKVTAAEGNAPAGIGDLSDASLFAHAMGPGPVRRR
jgi:hypothetical protein